MKSGDHLSVAGQLSDLCPHVGYTPSCRTHARRAVCRAVRTQQRRMSPSAQRHTVALVQFNTSVASRTFLDYESLPAAMDGVCALYEKELKALNPTVDNITYDIADLYTYLDQLADISLLVCAAVPRHAATRAHKARTAPRRANPRLLCACCACGCAGFRIRSTHICHETRSGSSGTCSHICEARRRAEGRTHRNQYSVQ